MDDLLRPYSRIEINKQFKRVKNQMHLEALSRGFEYDGKQIAYYTDVYTGLVFRGGENYEYEHIRSSENIHSKFKNVHTDKEIALIVNHRDNIGVTSFEINRFKDRYKIEERILNDDNLIRKFQIDVKLTRQNLGKADKSIQEMSNSILKNRKK